MSVSIEEIETWPDFASMELGPWEQTQPPSTSWLMQPYPQGMRRPAGHDVRGIDGWPSKYNVGEGDDFPFRFNAPYSLEGEEDPTWRGRGYWPPADAVTPTPPQPRGQDATCYPGDRRVAADRRGDFWCENGVWKRRRSSRSLRRPMDFIVEKCIGCAGVSGLSGLSGDDLTPADLVNQLVFAQKKAGEYKVRITNLLHAKTLTKAHYAEYRKWVSLHQKLRGDLVDLFRKNPSRLNSFAKTVGLSPTDALLKIEGAVIDNMVLTPEQQGAWLSGLEVAPLVVGGYLAGTLIVAAVAGLTISAIAAQDVTLAREQTKRLDYITKEAEGVCSKLPVEQRADCMAKILASASSAVHQDIPPGFFGKLADAITKPLGLALAAGLVYGGYRVVKARRQKESI